jgi:hypothetical protein
MSDEADVDKALCRKDCVAFLGAGYAGTVKRGKAMRGKIFHCLSVAQSVDLV